MEGNAEDAVLYERNGMRSREVGAEGKWRWSRVWELVTADWTGG